MAIVLSRAEGSAVLHNVSWRTYVSLLDDLAESSALRLTYDQGTLEIMSPTKKHERLNRVLAQLVEVLADELGIDMENLGSTTFKRQDLARGFEPDSCFYFAQAELVRKKETLDLSHDPPPELVIEIDLTSPSIDKDPIYAELGVREVWRYEQDVLRISKLTEGGYVSSETSEAFPFVTGDALTGFLRRSEAVPRPALLKAFREWIRQSSR